MTTYATNNPIGSMDPKDLFDNAQNLDFAINDITKAFWKDRFGRSRPTMFGMEQAFSVQLLSQQQRFDNFIQSSGYKVIGDYTAGLLTITEYNQLIRYQNEFYKLTAATALPFTTTGNDASSWANDSAHFVSVGDAALRQELAAPGGLALVGPGVMSRGQDRVSILQGRTGEYFSDYTTRGLGVNLVDPITGTGVATSNFNRIIIEDDRFNAVDDAFAPTKVDGLYIQHKFGGAGAKGGRHAVEVALSQRAITEPDNTDRNYVGLAATCTTSTGDGGASGANKGAYFGMNPVASHLGGKNIANLSSMECNTNTTNVGGNELVYHSGIQVVSNHNARGSIVDAPFVCSLKSASTVKWRRGIDFGNMNGTYPLGTDSTFANVAAETTIASGIVLPQCTTFVLKAGDVELTNAKLEIGSKSSAGTTYIDFNSSGNGNDYDVRLAVVGGSTTAGAAALQINAGEVAAGCNIRPIADNTYSLGVSGRRWSVIYAGTGTINTSDARHKPITESITDPLLDAWAEVSWVQFKFDDAIALKGEDGARWHFGLIAQRVEEVFSAHGIDGFQLGLLCFDEWENQYSKVRTNEGEMVTKTRTVQQGKEVKKVRTVQRPVMVKMARDVLVDDALEDGTRIKRVVTEEYETPKMERVPVLGADGLPDPRQPYVLEPVMEDAEEEYVEIEMVDATEEYEEPAEPEYVEVLDIPAGSRYGIRYEEALALEAALQRRNYARLLAGQEAMAARIEKLESLLSKAN